MIDAIFHLPGPTAPALHLRPYRVTSFPPLISPFPCTAPRALAPPAPDATSHAHPQAWSADPASDLHSNLTAYLSSLPADRSVVLLPASLLDGGSSFFFSLRVSDFVGGVSEPARRHVTRKCAASPRPDAPPKEPM